MLAKVRFLRSPIALVQESLLFRQVYVPRMILTYEFASKKERPPTAYQLFASANREQLVKLNPDRPKQEITKALHDRSREMSEEEKNPYKEDHDKQIDLYKAPLEKLPKKPLGVFGSFVKENNSRNMSDDDKEQLKLKYKYLVQEYNKYILNFELNLTDEERAFLLQKRPEEMRTLAKKKRKLLNVGKPKLPPGPFLRFMLNSLGKVESESPAEQLSILWERWQQLSDEEKEVYIEEYRLAREKYAQDLAEWNAKHPDAE